MTTPVRIHHNTVKLLNIVIIWCPSKNSVESMKQVDAATKEAIKVPPNLTTAKSKIPAQD